MIRARSSRTFRGHAAECRDRGGAERGLRVPEDIAVIGYDDIEYAAHTTPPLTTIAVPKEEMGRRAVRQAIAQMEQGEKHVYATTVVAHSLIVRSSCGAGTQPALMHRQGRRKP